MEQNLIGTWVFTQTWSGTPPYSYNAEFNPNGTIQIKDGHTEFFGTYQVLLGTNQISLAIANFNDSDGMPQSITAYAGTIWGQNMGGLAQGAAITDAGDSTQQGTWSASRPLVKIVK